MSQATDKATTITAADIPSAGRISFIFTGNCKETHGTSLHTSKYWSPGHTEKQAEIGEAWKY